MKSSIYLNDITTVDHAILNPNGRIQGGSLNLSCVVSGEVTEDENVVVDFGTVKKQIKSWIDSKECGFDHKLWVPVGSIPKSKNRFSYYRENALILEMPVDAVKEISDIPIQIQMEDFLKEKMPGLDFQAVLNVNTPFAFSRGSIIPSRFRYTHGLRDSTSWGCQNIAHGHFSYIYFEGPESNNLDSVLLGEEITKELDSTVFINKENIVNSKQDYIEIAYDTERGHFHAFYKKGFHKVVILDTETTIEFLVDYVAKRYLSRLKSVGAETLYVSEGLMKGACVSLGDY